MSVLWDGSSDSDGAAARRYHSITIGAKNTWTDYRLIPTERPVVAPPPVKTNFVEVPGADGSLDFTESLDSMIHYGDRTGSWEFYVCHEQLDIDSDGAYSHNYQWVKLWSRLLNELHGKRNSIILLDEWSDDPQVENRLYVGRTKLSAFQSDPSHSKIVIEYILLPHRYLSESDANQRINGIL